MIPPCLTLSNIRYTSRVKWSNCGKGVAPSPTPWCSSYWKGAFWSPLTTVANFTLLNVKFYCIIVGHFFSFFFLVFESLNSVWLVIVCSSMVFHSTLFIVRDQLSISASFTMRSKNFQIKTFAKVQYKYHI